LAIGIAAALFGHAAHADILVPLPTVEVPASDSVQVMSFDVPIVITSPDSAFDSFGYGVRFRVEPQAGATGSVTIAGGGAASVNAAFGDADISFSTQAGGLEAFVQAFNVSAQNLTTGEGLFQLDLAIASGTLGSFDLVFFDVPGEPTSIFNNSGGVVAGVTFEDGNIVVTPEPASAALLALASSLLLLQRRRPRGKRSAVPTLT